MRPPSTLSQYFNCRGFIFWSYKKTACLRRVCLCTADKFDRHSLNSPKTDHWHIKCTYIVPMMPETVSDRWEQLYSEWCMSVVFVDLCIIVQFTKKVQRDATMYQNFIIPFVWSLICFGRHTAHHQEPKTALRASGFSYMEGSWTCSWWTLSGTVCLQRPPNTSSNLPRMKNQRLSVQF
jgi:hypothetical protein